MHTIERLLYVLDQVHALACNVPAVSSLNPELIRWAEAGLNGHAGPGESPDDPGTLTPEAARVDPFPLT